MDVLNITAPNGARGIRILSNDGIEIEIIRSRSGTATFEITKYDEEGGGNSTGIKLSRKEVLAIVELLETKLHAMKRPKELFNRETGR